jgi:hypothetical protein
MNSLFPDDRRDEEVELVAPTTAALKPRAMIVFMIARKLRCNE